jgi:hypothetical protein
VRGGVPEPQHRLHLQKRGVVVHVGKVSCPTLEREVVDAIAEHIDIRKWSTSGPRRILRLRGRNHGPLDTRSQQTSTSRRKAVIADCRDHGLSCAAECRERYETQQLGADARPVPIEGVVVIRTIAVAAAFGRTIRSASDDTVARRSHLGGHRGPPAAVVVLMWTGMKRVQMHRGVRLPPNTRCVARGTKWGNPWRIGHVGEHSSGQPWTSEDVLRFYRTYAHGRAAADHHWLRPLRGHDLACWCPLDKACHADILLELLEESG